MASLSPSLARLFNEIDNQWPNRDRRTDGWLRLPQNGISEGHNPGARNLVHAIDVDSDGLWPMYIIDRLNKPGILYYIIWDRRVWSTKTGYDGHRYTGSNPHTDHLHIEIYQTVHAEQWDGWWGVGAQTGIGTPGGGGGGGGIGDAPSGSLGPADMRDPRDAMLGAAQSLSTLAGFMQGHGSGLGSLNRL